MPAFLFLTVATLLWNYGAKLFSGRKEEIDDYDTERSPDAARAAGGIACRRTGREGHVPTVCRMVTLVQVHALRSRLIGTFRFLWPLYTVSKKADSIGWPEPNCCTNWQKGLLEYRCYQHDNTSRDRARKSTGTTTPSGCMRHEPTSQERTTNKTGHKRGKLIEKMWPGILCNCRR